MSHRVWRTGVAALAAVVLLLIVPVAASGQTDPYPPGTAATCPASTVQPGDTITCSVEGFAADSEVEVAVQGVGWSRTYTVTADGDGVARVDITVPSDAAPGSMTVTFSGRDAAGDFLRVAVASLTVTGPGDAAGGGLVATGAPIARGLAVGVAAILLGAVAVTLVRRRPSVRKPAA